MKTEKIVMLVGPGYEDLEFWVVYMRMIEEGAEVKIVGSEAGVEYLSKSGGLKVKSEYRASEISPDEISAVLIPGGWAPDKLRRDKDILDLVRKVHNNGAVIGMICHAGLVGISAGIVRGKRATGSEGVRDDLENAGAVWVDEPAFRDGNLIWGRVVKDIPRYSRELVKALFNK
jgi:protease I